MALVKSTISLVLLHASWPMKTEGFKEVGKRPSTSNWNDLHPCMEPPNPNYPPDEQVGHNSQVTLKTLRGSHPQRV